MTGDNVTVVKIGGSTLGKGDTTIEDLVHLQKQGRPLGGGRGGRATGPAWADASLLRARRYNPELGFVGQVTSIDATVLRSLLSARYLPVIAPIALEEGDSGQLLNVNADTVAG